MNLFAFREPLVPSPHNVPNLRILNPFLDPIEDVRWSFPVYTSGGNLAPWPEPDFTLRIVVIGKKRPDIFGNASSFCLYSPKVLSILEEAGVRYETFNVEATTPSGEPLEFDYRVFRLLEVAPGVDLSRTETAGERHNNFRYRNLVANDATELPLLFTDANLWAQTLAREELKTRFEAEKVSGCQFTPLSQVVGGNWLLDDRQ